LYRRGSPAHDPCAASDKKKYKDNIGEHPISLSKSSTEVETLSYTYSESGEKNSGIFGSAKWRILSERC
jgi:hypothetical protein